MPLKPWKRLSHSVLFTNPWWVYKRDEYLLPNGNRREYHYVHTNGSSMVVPVRDDGRILMVNQYRYLVERESLEFPCGGVKAGSTHDQTARHEFAEETGFAARQLFQVGEFNPYNGITDEMCRVYVARELHHVGSNPDETEEFELLAFTAEDIDRKIASGEMWDGMSIAAWAIARPRLRQIP
jgi:ADP-ribose pyrophosphatase